MPEQNLPEALTHLKQQAGKHGVLLGKQKSFIEAGETPVKTDDL
jgi:hypothetical protein